MEAVGGWGWGLGLGSNIISLVSKGPGDHVWIFCLLYHPVFVDSIWAGLIKSHFSITDRFLPPPRPLPPPPHRRFAYTRPRPLTSPPSENCPPLVLISCSCLCGLVCDETRTQPVEMTSHGGGGGGGGSAISGICFHPRTFFHAFVDPTYTAAPIGGRALTK